MIRQLQRTLAITLSVTGAMAGYGQSVAEFEQMAAEQNPLLSALMLEYEAALEKEGQVAVWQGPQVSAAVPVLPVETRLGAQRLKIGAQQMFPWYGNADAQRNVYIAMSSEKYEAVRAAQLEISFQVKQAYLSIYGIEQKQAVMEKNLSLFGSLERIALGKVESGKTDLSDVLRIQLKSEELRAQIDILQARRERHEADLNKMTGRPPGAGVEVLDSFVLAKEVWDSDSLTDELLEAHPEMALLDRRITTSMERMALNDVSGKPVLGVGLEYALVTPRSDAAPAGNGRDILIPKFSATIPLQRSKYRARNREEQLHQLALQDRKEWLEDQLSAALSNALASHRETLIEARRIKSQQEILLSAIEILLSAYSAEGKSFDELLQLENQLLQLEIDHVESVVKSHLSKAAIERISGI